MNMNRKIYLTVLTNLKISYNISVNSPLCFATGLIHCHDTFCVINNEKCDIQPLSYDGHIPGSLHQAEQSAGL